MALPRNVRKNVNLFVDGRGQAGQIDEFNAPELTLKTEAYQGGGMAGPVELTMGHEALKCDFTLINYDPATISLIGINEGFNTQLTSREFMESGDGTSGAIVKNMRGKLTSVKSGSSKASEKGTLQIEMSLSYYKETIGGVLTHEIDVENMVWNRGGIDLLAAARTALGI